jgi:integrase
VRIPLTDRFLQSAKPGEYFDATVRGLSLRVTNHGAKTFYLTYSAPATGRRARLTLGPYPALTLAAARGRALEAKTLIEQGGDPRRRNQGGALTVADMVEAFIVARAHKRSIREIERRLRNAAAEMGAVKVSELHRRDVSRALDGIMRRGSPSEARRVFCDLRAMIHWAVARGDLDASPLASMRAPSPATVRERTLTDAEIKTLWNALPSIFPRSIANVRIIRLCLLLGQRSGEIAGMRKSELDLTTRVWHLPSSRVKNAKAHAVPLSDVAIAIIREAIADAGEGDHVFPGYTSRSLGNTLLVARRAGKLTGEHWTVHDLRRTAATGMAALGIAPHVVSRILNHSQSGGSTSITQRVYNQHSYADEKRAALDAWASRLAQIVGENVVRLAA